MLQNQMEMYNEKQEGRSVKTLTELFQAEHMGSCPMYLLVCPSAPTLSVECAGQLQPAELS